MNWSIIVLGWVCCALSGVIIGSIVKTWWLCMILAGVLGYCLMDVIFIPWSKI